ncbi:hypothetical protein [Archangium sp.]|uniref:hypothetical protein n=1 Tax=Archangium sp. TaxID=1872627 RepID=UPI002D224842|nr:hypothetical protein [Archangium sp.]HYO54870.1 hypothetical protein [Archangium sp.]
MVNPDIRRLQFLNDLIAQTLDVINQRSWVGGLSHTPYTDINNPYQVSQFGNVPLMQPQSVGMGIAHTPFQGAVPMVGQGLGYGQNIPANVFGGLTHTPFQGVVPNVLGNVMPNTVGQGLGLGYGQNIPANVFGGLAHTPFAWQTPYAQQLGQGLGFGQNIPANVFGGLAHTPFAWQTPQYGVGMGLPFQNPWMSTQSRFGYPQI